MDEGRESGEGVRLGIGQQYKALGGLEGSQAIRRLRSVREHMGHPQGKVSLERVRWQLLLVPCVAPYARVELGVGSCVSRGKPDNKKGLTFL